MSEHMAQHNERWKEVTALCDGLLRGIDPAAVARAYQTKLLAGLSQHHTLSATAANLLLHASLTQLRELPWAQSVTDPSYPRYSPLKACQTLMEACIAANWWQQDQVVQILVAVLHALRDSPMEQPLWEYLDYRVEAKGALCKGREPEVYRKIRREARNDSTS